MSRLAHKNRVKIQVAICRKKRKLAPTAAELRQLKNEKIRMLIPMDRVKGDSFSDGRKARDKKKLRN